MQIENTLFQKTALITGASRGIGKAIAQQFAQEGCNLILNSLHSYDALLSVKQELESAYPVNCQIQIGDIGEPAFVESLFAGLNSLDILINNAGISYIGLLQDMSVTEWRRIMQTNLDSVFYTCKHAVSLMLPKKEGKIINISSVWGNVGASMEAAYSASKAGVNGLTKALAKELAPSNIQVNAIACGVIDTDMNRCFSKEERCAIIDDIPANRFGMPEEIAQIVSALCKAPAYLTGQILTVDGGYQ